MTPGTTAGSGEKVAELRADFDLTLRVAGSDNGGRDWAAVAIMAVDLANALATDGREYYVARAK